MISGWPSPVPVKIQRGWSCQCIEATYLVNNFNHPNKILKAFQLLHTWTQKRAAATTFHKASRDTLTAAPTAWRLSSLQLLQSPAGLRTPFCYNPYSNSQTNQTLEGRELIISLRYTSWHCTRGRRAWKGAWNGRIWTPEGTCVSLL